MKTITFKELDGLAEDYRRRLQDQGQLEDGMDPFSKYDFIAGVLAGLRFALGENGYNLIDTSYANIVTLSPSKPQQPEEPRPDTLQ